MTNVNNYTRVKKPLVLTLLTSIALAINGCNSGNPNNNGNAATFGGRITEGLIYTCGGKSGATDQNGMFNLAKDTSCTFRVGQFSFSTPDTAIPDGVTNPYTIEHEPQKALKLAYILYSVAEMETPYSMIIKPELVDKVPVLNLDSSLEQIQIALIKAGITPKSYSYVKQDLERFVDEKGNVKIKPVELIEKLNSTYVRKFPALATAYAMDEEDFVDIYGPLNSISGEGSCLGDDINKKEIKNMSIASTVSSSCSKYRVYPIFKLGALTDKIDVNEKASKSSSTIEVTGQSNARSSTLQWEMEVKASASYMGGAGSAAYRHQEKEQRDSSDGSAHARITYANTGTSVSLATGTFSSSYDFTPYLLGESLSNIEAYVKPVITDGIITDVWLKDNHGYIDYTNSVYYQNIQILAEMERLFGLAKEQYVKKQDKRSLIVMYNLKKSINDAIKEFYANVGDSFVSKISAMNYAVAVGKMSFSTDSGQDENYNSASLSLSYSAISWSASTEASMARQNSEGWAKAFNNTQVVADAAPQGVIDTNGWAGQVNNMLKEARAGASISVPSASISPIAVVTRPDIVPKQAAVRPPDTVFKSLKEWEEYQKTGKVSDNDASRINGDLRGKVNEKGLRDTGTDAFSEAEGLVANDSGQVLSELEQLNNLQLQKSLMLNQTVKSSENTFKIDKMFVSGFETTRYAKVLPELRPNLSIPNEKDTLSGFPNVAKLMTFADLYGDVGSYLQFLAKYDLSGLKSNPLIITGYTAAYDDFAKTVYNVVKFSLASGKDISNIDAAQIYKNFMDKDSSNGYSLYKQLGNSNYYNYIINGVLNPDYEKVWRRAPGGYALMAFADDTDTSSGLRIFAPKKLGWQGGAQVGYGSTTLISSSATDVLELYKDVNKKNNTSFSPLFPIIRYMNNGNANLVFVEFAGPYQVVFGNSGSIAQVGEYSVSISDPVAVDGYLPPSEFKKYYDDAFVDYKVSYDINNLSWDNYLNWPNNRIDPKKEPKYNLLRVTNNNMDNSKDYYCGNKGHGWLCMYRTHQREDWGAAPFIRWLYAANYSNEAKKYIQDINGQPYTVTDYSMFLYPINSETSELFATSPVAFSTGTDSLKIGYLKDSYFDAAYDSMLFNK